MYPFEYFNYRNLLMMKENQSIFQLLGTEVRFFKSLRQVFVVFRNVLNLQF